MRVTKNKSRRAIFAAVLAIATGIFCLSTVERPTGSPQLVSDRQLSDFGELCTWPEADYSLTGVRHESREELVFLFFCRIILNAYSHSVYKEEAPVERDTGGIGTAAEQALS